LEWPTAAGRDKATTETNRRELHRYVSTCISVKPAANRVVDERPDSCNSNLSGTEKSSLLRQAGGEGPGLILLRPLLLAYSIHHWSMDQQGNGCHWAY